ncbi:hypothetical protein THAOC_22319 [Thalassiosira oceanica]|uniref:PABS domain-containing protein n=1 Tax=Thalassiosira oceanica TaxID=159749 RepID=K0RYU4_THAOC|nr:hypothetical protein THAOC_22319 [Thalassiosira oceanica]|eukprot:EJK57619.1 hypothetical protein THAOC_22319 [Thalassiosira oceanica]
MCRQWSLRRFSSFATQSTEQLELSKETELILKAVRFDDDDDESLDEKARENIKHPGHYAEVTLRFVIASLILTSGLAFLVGSIARGLLIRHGVQAYDGASEYNSHQLPAPVVLPGKEVPFTTYASKSFNVAGVSFSDTVHIDRRPEEKLDQGQCSQMDKFDEEKNASIYDAQDEPRVNDYSHNDDSDGLHLPAGQHLLVDIKDVDSEFLNDETRLATAMIELINESKLTLLSYHCHGLVPIGVSCAGVLLESHVAFHTWPEEGVITMDLFTCGGNPLVPVLPSIYRLFGVPPVDRGEEAYDEDLPEPTMLWSHKLRGFREGFAPGYDASRNPLDQDLGRYVLGRLDHDVKNEVVSSKTEFQTVDVYELMDPKTRSVASYRKSLEDGDSYEARHPELFAPDRVLFLDGVIQSTLVGDAPYHESIVHPAMITHPNPKRVAIIGGGEGATLREVLKHRTVEEASMIEIDEGVVDLSRQHLPEWQDCTGISHHEGSADWCFDDTRVNAQFKDAMTYFIDNFEREGAANEHDQYDVIIMDALDPNDEIEFAVYLYTSEAYILSLYNGLSNDGILVVQVGEVPGEDSPADETGRFTNRSIMQEKLLEVGFDSIHVYEEGHSGFLAPWSTMVAFKDAHTRRRWYRNEAEIDLALKRRILPTRTGDSSLRYFDGATMRSYQLPSRAFQTIYCRSSDAPFECSGADISPVNATVSIGYSPVYERRSSLVNNRRFGLTFLS